MKRGISPLISTVLLVGLAIIVLVGVFIFSTSLFERESSRAGDISEKRLAVFRGDVQIYVSSAEIGDSADSADDSIIGITFDVENLADLEIIELKFLVFGDGGSETIDRVTSIDSFELEKVPIDYDSKIVGTGNRVEIIPKAEGIGYVPEAKVIVRLPLPGPDDTCNNGVLDPGEIGIDCGGNVCPACPDGEGCVVNGDCLSGNCDNGICKPVEVCGNGIKESGEVCDGGSIQCTDSVGYIGTQDCKGDCSGYNACILDEFCGDLVVNGPEVCDGGTQACLVNGDSGTKSCRIDCIGFDICIPSCTYNPADLDQDYNITLAESTAYGDCLNNVCEPAPPTLPNGDACSSGSECASGNCYSNTDADGDSYPAQTGKVCQAAAGNQDDCYDSNADAKPGQTAYFRDDRGDGSFDFDCDGAETERPVDNCERTMAISGCTTIAPTGLPGYVGPPPNCGEAASFVTCRAYIDNIRCAPWADYVGTSSCLTACSVSSDKRSWHIFTTGRIMACR